MSTPATLMAALLPISAQKTLVTAEARTKKEHSYKPLSKQFRRDGFQYCQIAREYDVAIYEQKWLSCGEASLVAEVIRIRRREGFQIDGRFIEAAEIYPSSEAWGTDGFTLRDKEAAFAKLRDLA